MKRTTAAGLAAAAALGLFAAVLPATLAPAPAQAAPITVPAQAPQPVNLALTGKATASSVEPALPNNTASLAIDGNTATRWSSDYVNSTWLQVELAAAGPIDHVKLVWPNAAARAYTLETSLDGVQWTVAKSMTSTTGPGRTDEVALGVANAKFIRMMGSSRWSTFGYSISEFEIYGAPAPVVPDSLPLVPAPVASAPTDKGTFELVPGSRIVATGAAVDAANYFAAKARASTGFALPVTAGPASSHDVELSVAPDSSADKPESYTLQADAGGVKIAANTAAGALDGVQTLRQLFPQWIESKTPVATPWTIPGVVLSDYPRYEYRGIQIDVARSFYTVAEMKAHIDNAAQFKFNRLHIHLTDDQGWRIAMDQPAVNPSGIKYTDLTDISGKTAMTYDGSGNLMGTELGHTGYYTKADFAEIVRYAGQNGMVVVPEVDMPGHTTAALHAIPQLNSAGSVPKPQAGEATVPAQGTGDVGNSGYDADSPVTYEFTKQVLTQLAAMTPGPYIHIGGDESHSTPSDKYQKMVTTFAGQVTDLGKTMIGWNESAAATLPANSVVQYWNGDRQATATRVLANNAKVILSPAEKTYIPQKQDPSETAGGTWACGGGGCTLQNHYDWDPATYLPGIGDDKILGVETVQWGEWIRGMDQTEEYQYPRTLATAEVGWSPQSVKSYTDFSKRAGKLGGRLGIEGINYFHTQGVTWTAPDPAPATAVTVTDPATLPATSPVDLGIPATEFDAGAYLTLHKLPANTWLFAAVHEPVRGAASPLTGSPLTSSPLARASVAGTAADGATGWIRTDALGNAPLTVPAGLAVGDHLVTVQGASGTLAAFGSVTVAAVVEPTATPTTEPTVEPTTPPTTEPTAEPTLEPTTNPTIDPTVNPTTNPTVTPTTPTVDPTATPTVDPTADPTAEPTVDPTTDPTAGATTAPAASSSASATLTASPAVSAAASATAAPSTPAAAAAPGDLASTGSNSALMLGGALLALLAGMIAIGASRRRRSTH